MQTLLPYVNILSMSAAASDSSSTDQQGALWWHERNGWSCSNNGKQRRVWENWFFSFHYPLKEKWYHLLNPKDRGKVQLQTTDCEPVGIQLESEFNHSVTQIRAFHLCCCFVFTVTLVYCCILTLTTEGGLAFSTAWESLYERSFMKVVKTTVSENVLFGAHQSGLRPFLSSRVISLLLVSW